jgi:hypothetical protein
MPTTTIRLPWSEYFAPVDDIPRLRIAYVDRALERFVRLAAGGWPLLDRAIRCEDRRAVLAALPDNLAEVYRLVGGQRPQAEDRRRSGSRRRARIAAA